jgi:uncharacterized RDD family membrane protein YckC
METRGPETPFGPDDEDDEGLVPWIDTRLGHQALPIPTDLAVNPVSEQVGVPHPGTYGPVIAGCGRRLVAKAVDVLLVGGLFWGGVIHWLRRFSGEELLAWVILLVLGGGFLWWMAWVAYHLLCRGDTAGKRLLGLRVVDERVRPVRFGRSLGRVLAETLSFLMLGFGYLFALPDPQRRTFHDHLCGTRVVLRRTLPERH